MVIFISRSYYSKNSVLTGILLSSWSPVEASLPARTLLAAVLLVVALRPLLGRHLYTNQCPSCDLMAGLCATGLKTVRSWGFYQVYSWPVITSVKGGALEHSRIRQKFSKFLKSFDHSFCSLPLVF